VAVRVAHLDVEAGRQLPGLPEAAEAARVLGVERLTLQHSDRGRAP